MASPQQGPTRYVNQDDPTCAGRAPCYRTIQAAVKAAAAGDTVLIQPGVYHEQVFVHGKNNGARAEEADRIFIVADPAAPPGSVVIRPGPSPCATGYAIRVQQSQYITLRGLTLTDAVGPAIELRGTTAIDVERNRIVGTGHGDCDGGIVVNRDTVDTLIVNNLVHDNARNGITFVAHGGPHYVAQNTIHGNAWNGISVARGHQVVVVNNAITGNGTASGAAGGRYGVTRAGSGLPGPSSILLLNNLVCGNRLAEIDDALDGTDAGNLTPTGDEGPGVIASPGCELGANVYAAVDGLDGVAGTIDDDFSPAATSPAVDGGVDARTLGFDARFGLLLEADYFRAAARPRPGSATGDARFDIGALELIIHDSQAPTVSFLEPPSGAFVRGTVAVRAEATDVAAGVADVALESGAGRLTATLTPPPPAATVTASAFWSTIAVADGSHTLSAVATDRLGNRTTATRTIIVDNTPPETRITIGPSGTTAATDATFTFTGSDNLSPVPGLVFAWRIDEGAFGAFSAATSATVTALAEGSHAFQVKARDLAGNEDATPATLAFTVALRPVVTSLSPSAGPVGAFVTIVGSGFIPGATQVAFGGVAAIVASVTTTTITTTVPLDARTGLVTVATARGVGTSDGPFTVTTTQDFTLRAEPPITRLVPGASTTFTISLESGSTPFTGLATLSVGALPAGVAGAFLPATAVSGGQLRTLMLSATSTAPVGVANLTLTASAAVDGVTTTRSTTVTLDVIPGGRTAAVGQITFADGTPIPGVRLTLGGVAAATDTGGNFRLLDVPAGTQMLGIDANAAKPGLPIYAIDVDLVAGIATQLAPLRITPPPPPERFTPIATSAGDQVVTDARFPGASITLPAGVTIVGWDGTLKTHIALERLSPEALPVPPPPGATRSLYQIFFGTAMGGLPSVPLPVTVPNDQGLEPGEKAEIWYYDAAPLPGVPAGWRRAGLGTVSDDGGRVVSDPGVGLARFCGVCGIFCIVNNVGNQPNVNPHGPRAGEPVDLGTGLMIMDRTDLVLPGRLPALLRRSYNPHDPFGRVAGFELATGPGWTLSIDVVLLQESATVRRLILPGNSRLLFVRRPDGAYENTTSPDFAGAVLSMLADSSHTLRFKDGTSWHFATGYVPRVGAPVLIPGLGLLVAQTDRNGNTLTIVRDRFGAPARIIEPSGRSLTAVVDLVAAGVGRLQSVTDPLGRTVRYAYAPSAPFRLEAVTDPAGGVTRYTYDASGGIVTVTDPRGTTVLGNEYDAQGRVVRQTQADAGVWTFAYAGAAGAHTSATVIDPRGNTTVHRLDNAGFSGEVVDALGQSTRYERDAVGRVTAITDPLGRTTRAAYDGVGNLTRITDAAGHARTFTYEPTFNRVTRVTDALGNVLQLDYDARGNLTALTDPAGARTTVTHDSAGQPLSITDPLGGTTGFTYDTAGNLVTVADPLGHVGRREYDTVSRLIRRIDALGRSTAFGYDLLNRVETVLDSLGGVTRFGYDPNGNLLTATDARGGVTAYAYDAMDRLSSRTDPVGASETFEYDAAGNLTRHTDRKAQVATFAHDPLNRRVSSAYADATMTIVYDGGGRVVQATDSLGGTILNQHDALDRLLAQTTDLGTVEYAYDALGRRTSMTAPGQAPVEYGYDVGSRLTSITQAAQAVHFQYDPAGRRTRLTLPNQVSTEYQYDAASRLTALLYRNAAGPLGDLMYQYDATGNRIAVGGSFARTLLPEPVVDATYDGGNRQLQFGSRLMAYDANGNVTLITDASATSVLAWDARDRLVGMTTPSADFRWTYDADGRRTRSSLEGQQADHLYDRHDILQTSSPEGSGRFLRSLAIDELFGRDETEFYLADGVGSTLALTDPAGTVTTRYVYAPFGSTSVENVDSSNPFQFTGREQDHGTGVYSYRMRPYSPVLHRFLSEDPLGWLAGTNSYVYALNNPGRFTDPLGLDVTVALYRGTPGNPFAHIGVAVNSSVTIGFNPVSFSQDLFARRDVAGVIALDTHRMLDRIKIGTTPEQDELMRRLIAERLANPGAYNLEQRNCATFVQDVLVAGGVKVPNTKYPRILMDFLQSIYGRGPYPSPVAP